MTRGRAASAHHTYICARRENQKSDLTACLSFREKAQHNTTPLTDCESHTHVQQPRAFCCSVVSPKTKRPGQGQRRGVGGERCASISGICEQPTGRKEGGKKRQNAVRLRCKKDDSSVGKKKKNKENDHINAYIHSSVDPSIHLSCAQVKSCQQQIQEKDKNKTAKSRGLQWQSKKSFFVFFLFVFVFFMTILSFR
ncbi:hypothetical protein BC567DRAFT_54666 [Phyllosticta citribraziliensis]